MRVGNKVALVTGGASGIGEACCLRLAEEGAIIVCTDINKEGAQRVAEQICQAGGKATAMFQDVADEAQWKAVIDKTVSLLGRLDILVNNAGIGQIANIEEATLANWQGTMDINLNGVFLGCREAVKVMKKNGGGSIINISSIEGIVGWSMAPAYNASKGGVRILTKSVALYCCEQNYNIRVNSVHPGFVATAMVESIATQLPAEMVEPTLAKIVASIPMGQTGESIDVANGVLFLASEESKYMTGSELVIDGGYTAQ